MLDPYVVLQAHLEALRAEVAGLREQANTLSAALRDLETSVDPLNARVGDDHVDLKAYRESEYQQL